MIRPWLDCNGWAIPRPRLTGHFEGYTASVGAEISNGYSNGYSDPVISVGLEISMRPRIARWLDWLLPHRGDCVLVPKGWCRRR